MTFYYLYTYLICASDVSVITAENIRSSLTIDLNLFTESADHNRFALLSPGVVAAQRGPTSDKVNHKTNGVKFLNSLGRGNTLLRGTHSKSP